MSSRRASDVARMTLEFDLEDAVDHDRAVAVIGLLESMRNGHALPGDEWTQSAIAATNGQQDEPPFDPADEWPTETAAPAEAGVPAPEVGDTQSAEADDDDADDGDDAEAPELRDEAFEVASPSGYSEQSVDEKELKAKTKADLVRIAIFNEIFTEERIRTEKPTKQTLIDSIVAYSTLADEDDDGFADEPEASNDDWTTASLDTADNRHGGVFASPAPTAPVAADDGWPAAEPPTSADGDWGAAQAPPEADDWNS